MVEQIKQLVGNGYREVVLTGVDITSYGADLPGAPTLGKLVQAILRHVPDLPRLRISSIDSIEADEALYDAVAQRSPADAASASVAAVGRRHDPQAHEAPPLAATTRWPSSASCGRCGPTWCSAPISSPAFPPKPTRCSTIPCASSSEADLTYLHVFPYSPRHGTPAARMPQVNRRVARERAAQLRARAKRQFAELAAAADRAGRAGAGRARRCRPHRAVHAGGHAGRATGRSAAVRITGAVADGLVGEVLRAAA